MERDFMGLSSKEPLATVKEEINNDGCEEIGFTKGSEIQWPFSNKATAFPSFMHFGFVQEDKAKRIVPNTLMPSGFKSISTSDSFKSSGKRSATKIQAFQLSNQAFSVPVSNSFSNNHLANVGDNLLGLSVKQPLLGGIPVTAHSILPSVVGTTGPCVKASGSQPQLTIFYAGSVNVYNDISLEKAQAIMLLAGNGYSIAPNSAEPRVQVSAPNSKPATVDCGTVTQPINSPVCDSSHTTAVKTGNGSTNAEELMTAKMAGVATTQHMVNTAGSVATSTMLPSGHSNFYAAIPQARKASLALFLEKRKQRVMNAAPYRSSSKKSSECTATETASVSSSKESTVI